MEATITPESIIAMLDKAEAHLEMVKRRFDATPSTTEDYCVIKLGLARCDIAEAKAAFATHAVSTEEGDLILDALEYAVSQSTDEDWANDVRALRDKLMGRA